MSNIIGIIFGKKNAPWQRIDADGNPVDVTAGEPDLLLRLAQRGVRRRGIAFLEPAAGKADLPRVVVKVVGAPGQQHRRGLAAHHQRHQHRRWLGRTRAREVATIAVELALPARALGEPQANALQSRKTMPCTSRIHAMPQ